MKQLLLAALLFVCKTGFAGTVSGTVTDEKGNPLPFASVSVQSNPRGAIANSKGFYSLTLPEGQHTLVCQHIGYRSQTKELVVGAGNQTLNFSLAEQDLKMAEVVIKKGEDPALEIMRKTIAKREFYNKQTDSMTVDVYIKGLVRSRQMPDKVFGQKIDKTDMQKEGLDSTGKGILFLSESLTKVSYKRPDKLKLDVISSRQSGGDVGFDFPFFINFYTPNVQLFSGNLNPRGFISPLADAAFHYYKFRFEGSFFEGNKMVDRIRVTPRRKNEPLFEGYLQIVDEEWRIHSLNLSTNSGYGLDLLDTIRVTQIHSPVEDNVYKTTNQVVSLAAKFFGFDVRGDFLNVYSNYNLNPGFGKKYFNRVLVKYDSASLKRDSAYWNNLRPVPLESEERQNFSFKDSVRKTELDSLHRRGVRASLRQKQPLRIKDFLLGGFSRYIPLRRGQLTYRFEPFLFERFQYNTVEGISLTAEQNLLLTPWWGNKYSLTAGARYGFANRHLMAWGVFTVQPRKEEWRNRYWRFTGGKQLLQFNRENPVNETMNTLATLVNKQNYLKLYEAWRGLAEYNNRFESGLELNVSASYEDRIPVENRADFTLSGKKEAFLPNHPYELAGIAFLRHKTVAGSVALRYQPGQRYIQYPTYKMPVGSSWPTLELRYTKGFKRLLGSTADFDKWQASVYDETNLRLLGSFKYRLSVGGFLNRRQVDIPDYTHFNGNQYLLAAPYLNSFQLAPYYRYSNTERLYGLLHAEHHFNGLLTNKIPLFNKLKWNLVAGTNTFYVNRNNYYVEAFAGLENIFKLIRVDFVTALQAANANPFGVRVGLGGVLGGNINRRR